MLATELDAARARATVERAHRRFEELNGRLVRASTDWQLRPTPADRFAAPSRMRSLMSRPSRAVSSGVMCSVPLFGSIARLAEGLGFRAKAQCRTNRSRVP